MNMFFYAGQAGLLTTAICGMGIVFMSHRFEPRLPWYQTIFVWIICLVSVFTFSHPYYTHVAHVPLPAVYYLLRVAIGLVFLGGLSRVVFGPGHPLPDNWVMRINVFLAVTSVAGLAVVFGIGVNKGRTSDQAEIKEIKRKLDRNSKIFVSDTARSARLEKQNDSLLVLLGEARTENKSLNTQVKGLSNRILDLSGELTNVTRQLRRVMAMLDRLRKSPVIPVSNQQPTPMNFDILDPQRVKAVPLPGKGHRSSGRK